jgi:hypothetical protein
MGFAGYMDSDGQIMAVDHVYLEEGKPTRVTEGVCKFFFSKPHLKAIMCGAKIDEGTQRTVPIVVFEASPRQ